MLLQFLKLLCFSVLLSTSHAFLGMKNPAGVTIEPESLSQTTDRDLSLPKLIMQQLKRDESVGRVQQIIDDHTTESTCNKAAYSSLTYSCSFLESGTSHGSSRSTDTMLDVVKTTFAVRLAVCELSDVGQDIIPADCTFLVGDQRHALPRELQQDFVDGQRMKACLRGMHDDPRAWNSFSNAKQNAIKICHATRVHVERAAMLEQLQQILHAHSEASEVGVNITLIMMEAQSDFALARERLSQILDLDDKLRARYKEDYERYMDEWQIRSHQTFEELRESQKAAFQDAIADSHAAHSKMLDLVDYHTDHTIDRLSSFSVSLDALQGELSDLTGNLKNTGSEVATLANHIAPLNQVVLDLEDALREFTDNFTAFTTKCHQEFDFILKTAEHMVSAWQYLVWAFEPIWYLKSLCLYVILGIGLACTCILLAFPGLHRLALRYLMRPIFEIRRGFRDANSDRTAPKSSQEC